MAENGAFRGMVQKKVTLHGASRRRRRGPLSTFAPPKVRPFAERQATLACHPRNALAEPCPRRNLLARPARSRLGTMSRHACSARDAAVQRPAILRFCVHCVHASLQPSATKEVVHVRKIAAAPGLRPHSRFCVHRLLQGCRAYRV